MKVLGELVLEAVEVIVEVVVEVVVRAEMKVEEGEAAEVVEVAAE